jgi:hypothetical protein
MLVLYEGAIHVGDRREDAIGVIFLDQGDLVRVTAETDARFLVIAGKPIGEPVAWGGPFVMNSREEVAAAFDDYRAGRF